MSRGPNEDREGAMVEELLALRRRVPALERDLAAAVARAQTAEELLAPIREAYIKFMASGSTYHDLLALCEAAHATLPAPPTPTTETPR